MRQVIKNSLKIYEEAKLLMSNEKFSSLEKQEQDQIRQSKKEALNFLDGLINLLNVQLGETQVNVNSSTNEKI